MTKKVGSVATPPAADAPLSGKTAEQINKEFTAKAQKEMNKLGAIEAPDIPQKIENKISSINPPVITPPKASTDAPLSGKTADQIKKEFAAKTQEESTAKTQEERDDLGVVGEPITPMGGGIEPDTSIIKGQSEIKIPQLNVAGKVAPFQPQIPETSLAQIYKIFNPEPKRRTTEEQEAYERQRRASGIILGISDAINGLSNLGATIVGAPSRAITPIAGKWAEVLNTAEKERQQKSLVWREGLMKYAIEDFKRHQKLSDIAAEEKRKAAEFDRQQTIATRNAKEIATYKADLDKSAREHQAGITAEQKKTEHGYNKEIAQIRVDNANAKKEDNAESKRPYFTTTVGGSDVDVTLRKNEDYHRLYDLIKPYADADSGVDTQLSAILKELEAFDTGRKEDPDGTRSLAAKQNFVRKYFSKYYDKIKNTDSFKHLNIVFKDGAGNTVTFSSAKEEKPKTAEYESKDPLAHLNEEPSQGFWTPNYGGSDSIIPPWKK